MMFYPAIANLAHNDNYGLIFKSMQIVFSERE